VKLALAKMHILLNSQIGTCQNSYLAK